MNTQPQQQNRPQQKPKNQLATRPQQQSVVKRVETNPLLMLDEHWRRLEAISERAFKANILPKSIDSKEKAFIVALKGVELGLPPMYAMEHISVINGKAGIDGQAMLRLIYERCPGARVEFLTPPDKELNESEVLMARPGSKEKVFRFTMDDARRAKLTDKPGPWQSYPKTMLRWRPVSEGGRFIFPDVIGGLYLNEELGANVNESGEVIDAEFTAVPTSPTTKPAAEAPATSSEAPQDSSAPAVESKPQVQWQGSSEASDADAGEYIVPIGNEIRGKKLRDLPLDKILGTVQYLHTERANGKPVSGLGLDFLKHAERFLEDASMKERATADAPTFDKLPFE